jgi:hypothetical protein
LASGQRPEQRLFFYPVAAVLDAGHASRARGQLAGSIPDEDFAPARAAPCQPTNDLQAQYYDGYAKRTDDPAAKRKLLLQAQEAYKRLARTGNSAQVKRANARLTEMVENKELE